MLQEHNRLKLAVNNLPLSPGVYIFRDEKGETLYAGKAVNLKNRVRSYFHPSISLGAKTQAMVKKIKKIEYIEVESEIEALILEADLIKRLKPYYNVQWKDDKARKYIKIFNFPFDFAQGRQFSIFKNKEGVSSEDFARITTTRRTDDSNAYYFGPFPEGRTVNKVLSSLRRFFGFADCSKTKFRKYQKLGRGCLYADLNLCPAPCAGLISSGYYKKQINHITVFLQGKKKKLLRDLEKEMKKAAQEKNFEQAAKLRDEIKRMEYVTQTFRGSSDYLEHPNLLVDQRREELETLLKELQTTIHKPPTSFRIEAYDISNISGKKATGSRVTFIDGEPDKSEYRRYKIKIEGKPDDVTMMKEVLTRRLQRLVNSKFQIPSSKQKKKTPDLILVDGGLGQLNVAQSVLKEYNLKIPVVALAKRWETLFIPTDSGGKEISLSKDSPALKLLQRIRDEAHRFAVAYHRKLRKKELF